MAILHSKKLIDGGVSESIGFLLIFTIVIAGIGLVTMYGYPLLLQQQVGADIKIMEKNMIVLQNDIKSLAYKTVPYKETSLKIGGGSLTVYNSSYTPSTFTLDITNPSETTHYLPTPFQSGELSYESISAQTDISLQNGDVVMRARIDPGSVMLAEPRWFYDTDTKTMVINLINITSSDIISKEGIGTVQMNSGETNYSYFSPVNSKIRVKYTPDSTHNYSVAWDNYLTQSLDLTAVSPYVYETKDVVNTLVIKKYEVQIKNI
jgi:hypothetical protein